MAPFLRKVTQPSTSTIQSSVAAIASSRMNGAKSTEQSQEARKQNMGCTGKRGLHGLESKAMFRCTLRQSNRREGTHRRRVAHNPPSGPTMFPKRPDEGRKEGQKAIRTSSTFGTSTCARSFPLICRTTPFPHRTAFSTAYWQQLHENRQKE